MVIWYRRQDTIHSLCIGTTLPLVYASFYLCVAGRVRFDNTSLAVHVQHVLKHVASTLCATEIELQSVFRQSSAKETASTDKKIFRTILPTIREKKVKKNMYI
jgi:hypothetical protein